MGAAPIEFGALVVMLALLAKSDFFADLKPAGPPEDFYGLEPPTVAFLSFNEWEKLNPGGSRLDYHDYRIGA